jgi:hypothetical protein
LVEFECVRKSDTIYVHNYSRPNSGGLYEPEECKGYVVNDQDAKPLVLDVHSRPSYRQTALFYKLLGMQKCGVYSREG